MIVNYLLCFFKEPGIIPRNYEILKLNSQKNESKSQINPDQFDGDNNINLNKQDKSQIKYYNSYEHILKTAKNKQNNDMKLVPKIDAQPNENNNINEIGPLSQKTGKRIINIMPELIEKELSKEERKKIKEENLNNSLIFIPEEGSKDVHKENVEINNNISNNNNGLNTGYNTNNTSNNNINNLNENNQRTDEKKFANKYGIKENTIPSIFQKKPCVTCNIMRPSKCSHCKICDNCIMELDQ